MDKDSFWFALQSHRLAHIIAWQQRRTNFLSEFTNFFSFGWCILVPLSLKAPLSETTVQPVELQGTSYKFA